MLNAIETAYGGYRFRSRLEARWAVFLDALDLGYRYEPEGYDLGSDAYLLDFWLPRLACFVEIKPKPPDDDESNKARWLAVASGHPVYVLAGEPRVPDNTLDPAIFGITEAVATAFFSHGGDDWPYFWCECPQCGAVQFEGRADRIRCGCPKTGDRGHNSDSPRLLAAYAQARAARFEFAR